MKVNFDAKEAYVSFDAAKGTVDDMVRALTAYAKARRLIEEHGALPVPAKLRNAPTQLSKQMGYGKGYKYPHDFEGNYVEGESYLPDELVDDED